MTQSHGGNEVEVYRYTPPPLAGPPNGQITQLTGAYSTVDAVNAQGNFVGWQGGGSSPHAFFASASGELTDLGTLGGNASYAQGLNDSNQVVGMSLTGAKPVEIAAGAIAKEAFVYSNGIMTGIGTLGGQTSVAQAINNAGQVVGDSSLPNQESHALCTILMLECEILAIQELTPLHTTSTIWAWS
jgi:probable HAF family extracellular repeat protein